MSGLSPSQAANPVYVARGIDGKPLGHIIARETAYGCVDVVTARVLVRIMGARSAWDYVPFLCERTDPAGKLTVRTVTWYEREGRVVA